MVSLMEIMQLCRLCLVKEQVNVPIFEEQDDIRQICLKITSCLPVKITKEDRLPKKICDGCLYKLELLYQFYNTTVNAEKQLLTWLEQINMDASDKNFENLETQSTQPQATVKQEKLEPVESTNENPDMSTDAQNFMLQPESYQPEFTFKESQGSTTDAVDAAENSDEPLAKRPRRGRPRQATKPIPPESLDSSDNDNDNDNDNDAGDSMLEMTVTKTEEESESEGDENVDDPEPTKFEAVGEDTEQPGPSGLGKGGADGPSTPSRIKSEDVEEASYIVTPFDIKQENSEGGNKEIIHGSATYTCERSDKDTGHKCDFCDKYFVSKTTLTTHILRHTKEVRYRCDRCERGYFWLNELKLHQNVHHTTHDFFCAKCEKGFKTKSYLKRHLATHDPSKKEYVCGVCSAVLHHRNSYYRHLGRHRDEGRHTCDMCGKSLSSSYHLGLHKRIHTGERPFVCGICERAFKDKKSLQGHMRTHSKEKPYGCKFCDRSFARHTNLKVHLQRHTGERPHHCSFCESKFVSKQELARHSRKHVPL